MYQTSANNLLAAIFAAIFMGTIGLVSRFTDLDSPSITFFRLGLGALFLLGFILLRGAAHQLATRPAWQLILSGVFLSSFIVCYIQAMQYTSMANAIMMIYLAPLAASVFAHIFLEEKLSRVNYLLVLLAIFGFAMMLEFELALGADENLKWGLIYGLGSLLTYAGYILVNRVMPTGVPIFTRTFYQLSLGALCMLPFIVDSPLPQTLNDMGWLIFAGLVPGFLAILLAVKALNALPSALFGTLAYCEPVTVVLLGWTLFGETLNSLQIIGCATIILSGAAQAAIFSNRSRV